MSSQYEAKLRYYPFLENDINFTIFQFLLNYDVTGLSV